MSECHIPYEDIVKMPIRRRVRLIDWLHEKSTFLKKGGK